MFSFLARSAMDLAAVVDWAVRLSTWPSAVDFPFPSPLQAASVSVARTAQAAQRERVRDITSIGLGLSLPGPLGVIWSGGQQGGNRWIRACGPEAGAASSWRP